MGEEVRLSDITDLKGSIKVIHERIDKAASSQTTQLVQLGIKQDEIQKDIRDLLMPIGEVKNKVETNEKAIVEVKGGLNKWDNRAWGFVLVLIIEMAMIIYQFYK